MLGLEHREVVINFLFSTVDFDTVQLEKALVVPHIIRLNTKLAFTMVKVAMCKDESECANDDDATNSTSLHDDDENPEILQNSEHLANQHVVKLK